MINTSITVIDIGDIVDIVVVVIVKGMTIGGIDLRRIEITRARHLRCIINNFIVIVVVMEKLWRNNGAYASRFRVALSNAKVVRVSSCRSVKPENIY